VTVKTNLKSINYKIFLSLNILILSIHSSGHAQPYNEKHAFCADKLSIHLSQYENTKRYNECMRNVHNLIREHEEQKEKRRLDQIRRQEQWERDAPRRRRNEMLKRKEKERIQKMREEQYRKKKEREKQKILEEERRRLEEERRREEQENDYINNRFGPLL